MSPSAGNLLLLDNSVIHNLQIMPQSPAAYIYINDRWKWWIGAFDYGYNLEDMLYVVEAISHNSVAMFSLSKAEKKSYKISNQNSNYFLQK